MNLASALVAIGSLALLSACSTLGSSGEGEDAPTQWKTVTRIVNGNSVTYQVPVNQKVPNNVNTRPWVTGPTTAKAAPSAAGAAAPAAPLAHTDEVARAGSAAGAESSAISQDAEIALGRAEIAVQDAQTRLETARTALNRAREAARAGDSASTVKFANTAVSISRPDH